MTEALENQDEQAPKDSDRSRCPTCGDEFSSEQGMKSHHAQVHGESLAKVERVCDQCGDRYETEAGYAEQSRFCSRECWNAWQRGRSKPSLEGENNPSWKGGRASIECEWCGDEFEVDQHAAEEARFCSQECHGAWQSEHLTGEDHFNWKGGDVLYECEECGIEFEAIQAADRRFCSRDCYASWQSRNMVGENHPSWEGGKVTLECDVCGEEFKVKPSHASKRRCCSWECKGAWRGEGFSGEDHPNWKGGKTTLECEVCEDEFSVDPHREGESRFCSEECWKEHISVERVTTECEQCGVEFTIPATNDDQRRFCSLECYGKWASIHRTGQDSPLWRGGKSIYDAVKKQFHGLSWETISRRHRRREPQCRLCGSTQGLDVHHIVPIMSGGTNERWNLMTLCVACHNRAESVAREYMPPVLIGEHDG